MTSNREQDLEAKLHLISNKFVLDVYENTRNGRNSIRAGVRMNKALIRLIEAEANRRSVELLESLPKTSFNDSGHSFDAIDYDDIKDRIAELKREAQTID